MFASWNMESSGLMIGFFTGIINNIIMSIMLFNGQMNLCTGFWLFRKRYSSATGS